MWHTRLRLQCEEVPILLPSPEPRSAGNTTSDDLVLATASGLQRMEMIGHATNSDHPKPPGHSDVSGCKPGGRGPQEPHTHMYAAVFITRTVVIGVPREGW